jgi:hypothetical protein
MRAASRGAVAMAMLLIVAIWEFLRTIPGALEKITLEGLFESIGDIFSDPESVFPLIVFLLVLWALIAIAKFCVGVIDGLLLHRVGSGPSGLDID